MVTYTLYMHVLQYVLHHQNKRLKVNIVYRASMYHMTEHNIAFKDITERAPHCEEMKQSGHVLSLLHDVSILHKQ
jgi:hypothetical protein